ncbi:putative glutamine amidotransferase [Alkalihalobacillus xiaoxiensis]|uniref:Glutamine amidotransferase n=1 Tax=Shouchella xiaoxiensis TaxID=766895 RepID=A0ABS2SSX4_9BACI|nr:gamma-glutamyl-gamma-aminobutyrate hydrolase family protein [Shouchella xiaoxiensis]MBM7838597.1 putative glutamine amidotransferase [Shouchella xiaoxiensis]
MSIMIGVSSSIVEEGRLSTALDNVFALDHAHILPVVLPNLAPKKAEHYVAALDGILLTGGGDINPGLFNEDPHPALGSITPERDEFELAIAQAALKREMPILAICRGVQILAIAAGGDMYQDLPSQFNQPLIQHRQVAPRGYGSHRLSLAKHSRLASIANGNELLVNSFHHQAVRQVPSSFKATAWTTDGVIEAIERTDDVFQVGVQWHPEHMKDVASANLFAAFIQACKWYKGTSPAS